MKNTLYILFVTIMACQPNGEQPNINYTPFSKTVIGINVINSLKDTLYIEAKTNINIPRGGSESNIVSIFNSGTYYLHMEIDRPVSSQIIINNESYNVLTVPNDTTEITIRENSPLEIGFTRSHKAINEYYQKKRENLNYSDIRFPLNQSISPKSTYNSLKNSIDSVVNVELMFFKNYQKSNKLPPWFIDYEYAEIIYSGAGLKTQMPNYNKIFKIFSDSLPIDYFNYLKQIEINDESAILSSKYLWFLDDYFIKGIPDGYNKLSGFERSSVIRSYILDQSIIKLSGTPKDVYHKYSFSRLIKYYSDSLEIDSLARKFGLTEYTALIRLSGTKSKNGLNALNLNSGDTIPEFYVTNELDSLISIKEFRNKIVYINFWATWCGPCIQNIPALNKMIADFENDEKIVFLNICIDSEKDKWPSIISKHKLKGINLLAEGNWNSNLRSYFNIKGIPHYAILKENNILEENFANKAPLVKERISEIRDTTGTKNP